MPIHGVGKSTLLLGVTGVLTQVFGFIYRIFLARMVSAEVLGLFQLIMPVYSVAISLTAAGLTVAVSQRSATLLAEQRSGSVKQLVYSCVAAFLILIGVFATFVFIFYDPISVYILGDARTATGLLLLMPCLALTGVENLHKHYFYGTGNVRPAALVELLEMLVRALAVLTLLHLFLPQNEERSVALIVCGMILCELFSSITLFMLARRDMTRRRFYGQNIPTGQLMQQIGAVAAPVGVSAVAGTLMNAANSVLLPARLVYSGVEVGQAMSSFGIVSAMTMPLLSLPTALIGALNMVLLPSMSECVAKRDCVAQRRRLHKSVRLTVVTMLPCMALIYLLGDDLGVLLFGQVEVGTYLAPMAAGTFFACLCSMLAAALNGMGQQKRAASISILTGAIALGFTYFFVALPGVGLWGYAAGFLVSGFIGACLSYRAVSKKSKLKFDWFSWVIAPGLATLLMGLCVNLLHPILLSSGIGEGVAVLASILFGGTLYSVCLAAMGVRLFT